MGKLPLKESHKFWIKFLQKARNKHAGRMMNTELPESLKNANRRLFEQADRELGHRLKMLVEN